MTAKDESQMCISETFQRLNSNHEKALVCFVMAGDPSLDQLPKIIACLNESGADLIEIGLPFSDPIADGPTIQAAGQRSLDQGTNPLAVFAMLSQIESKAPLVLMGYYNTALRIGLAAFANLCKSAHISGVILSDLIPDEAGEWISIAREANLDTIFLAAPTSTDERLKRACQNASGFIYAVSRAGVTGAQESLADDAANLVARLRIHTSLPICVGFGISSPDQVSRICKLSDGAIIGSKLVQMIHESWNTDSGKAEIESIVRSWKDATRG